MDEEVSSPVYIYTCAAGSGRPLDENYYNRENTKAEYFVSFILPLCWRARVMALFMMDTN